MKASGKSIALPVLGGLIVTLAAVVVAVRHWHAAPVAPKPGWLVRLDADAPRTSAHWIEDLERRGQPEMAQEVRDWLVMDDLLRLPHWGQHEFAQVLRYEQLWNPQVVLPPHPNRETQRLWGTSAHAASTMATRLKYRGPVAPEVRERIKQVLLERSKGVDRYTRHSAATQLSHSGLWREPEVWARLQQMTRDPEPMVAAQARRIVHRLTARLERQANETSSDR